MLGGMRWGILIAARIASANTLCASAISATDLARSADRVSTVTRKETQVVKNWLVSRGALFSFLFLAFSVAPPAFAGSPCHAEKVTYYSGGSIVGEREWICWTGYFEWGVRTSTFYHEYYGPCCSNCVRGWCGGGVDPVAPPIEEPVLSCGTAASQETRFARAQE
jgi:hypothetical protein